MELEKEEKKYYFFNRQAKLGIKYRNLRFNIGFCILACIPFIIFYSHQAYENEKRIQMMSSSRGVLTGSRIYNDYSYSIKQIEDFDKFNISLITFLEKDKITIKEITKYLSNEKDIYYEFLNDDIIIFSKHLNSNRIFYILNVKNEKATLNVKDIAKENIINFQKLELDNKNIAIKKQYFLATQNSEQEYLTIEINGTK